MKHFSNQYGCARLKTHAAPNMVVATLWGFYFPTVTQYLFRVYGKLDQAKKCNTRQSSDGESKRPGTVVNLAGQGRDHKHTAKAAKATIDRFRSKHVNVSERPSQSLLLNLI